MVVAALDSPSFTMRPALSKMNLLDLPNEVLAHILSFLDSPPPSERVFIDLPQTDWTKSDLHVIKVVSLLSKRLRLIVLPLLFRHVSLDPYYLSSCLDFLNNNQITAKVSTVTAHLQGPCSHVHPAWWARLLNDVPALVLRIGCAPHIFTELIQTSISTGDAWAFNMPYQFLELSQTPDAAKHRISYSRLPNILTARPWRSLRINEGSSLAAYTRYEYFLKRPPSLMAALQSHISLSSSMAYNAHIESASSTLRVQSFLDNLETFSFVAIFPFYNHVDNVLKCIRQMPKLRRLFVKLCPEPESTVLADEMKEANYHIDLNDPWTEFNTAYSLIAYTVNQLTQHLDAFISDDVKMAGIRDTLELNITEKLEPATWSYDGDGVWTRRRQPSESQTPAT